MIFIYTLSDPSTDQVKYIGKTNNLKERYKYHLYECTVQNSKKNTWIKSLLMKDLKPKMEILDTVPEEEWQFWEVFYISLFKSWNFKLKNSTPGGDGIVMVYTEERRKKLSEKFKGRVFSETWRKNLSEAHKGKKLSEEHKRKLSEKKKGHKYNLGREVSEETRQKLRERVVSEETRKKISISQIGNTKRKGKFHSEETRRKIGEKSKGRTGNKGIPMKEETKRKLSEINKGKKQSLETINKRREKMIGRPSKLKGTKRCKKN